MNTPEHFMLYKLIVLYLLDHVTSEITKTQISDYILTKGYTDFITLQLAFSELEEAEMINSRQIRNRTILSITEEGQRTIESLQDRITPAIRQDIISYLQNNHFAMQQELSIQTDYHILPDKSYESCLTIKDKSEELVKISLNLPSKELAVRVCDNWERKNEVIYEYLVRELLDN